MPFLGRAVPAPSSQNHKCRVPGTLLHRTWVIWRCPQCSAIWRLEPETAKYDFIGVVHGRIWRRYDSILEAAMQRTL